MSDETPIILTRHAVERGRERMGLNERQLSRLMRTIHRKGATRAFMETSLMRWFDRVLGYEPNAMRESAIHAGHLFVVERGILITIKPVPAVIARKALAAARLNRENQG